MIIKNIHNKVIRLASGDIKPKEEGEATFDEAKFLCSIGRAEPMVAPVAPKPKPRPAYKKPATE